ncbi:TetR/AcrR family transcriptional regulator [Glycomyces arizonensis]|uniref:TetR/AcrR family transcriptional regulator n=1 Tax=Glycomyces arizonensis TaxID=256035 RepID=UPI00040BF78B|nr:TetR family transcriptional regulator [Glycomyces arizonensis]
MSRPGLRERKKTETLRRMQEEALRLFEEQGYDATTIEQIAEAAGVSPSTFYRYFPTKEDVVVQDEYDPMIVAAFRRQPEGAAPIDAFRSALAEQFAQFSPEDMARLRGRVELVLSVPALRARQVQQVVATERMIGEMVAERTGRSPGDLEVRNFAAALIATWSAGILVWVEGGGQDDLTAVLGRCLDHLEAGVPL